MQRRVSCCKSVRRVCSAPCGAHGRRGLLSNRLHASSSFDAVNNEVRTQSCYQSSNALNFFRIFPIVNPPWHALHIQEPAEDNHRFYVVDGNPAELQQDWRLFRAQLVAKEMNQGASLVKNTMLRPFDIWAHPIAQPEAGCLLLARQSGLGMFSHSIVLITEHGKRNRLRCYSQNFSQLLPNIKPLTTLHYRRGIWDVWIYIKHAYPYLYF